MKNFLAAIREIKIDLPTLGIFAFALASTWSLYNLFNSSAIHPTWLYWIPAALCEVVTAWLTQHVVSAVYQITRSNITNQDRRFFKIVAGVSGALVLPTFIASILANWYEFQGQVWLALLFPVAVAGCAVGAQIPRSVAQHRRGKSDEGKAELRKVKRERDEVRAELARLRAESAQSRQLRRADKTAYANICAGLNGGTAPTTPRGVNDLLNDEGYYAVPDSTARTWAKKGETP